MRKEDKDLLLKYLCAALSYGVKVHCEWNLFQGDRISEDGELVSINVHAKSIHFKRNSGRITEIPFNRIDGIVLPYLRPISNMTKEEKIQMAHDCYVMSLDFEYKTTDMVALWNTPRVINWLLEHHFDFLGLISKGLAIAVTEENNPYEKEL